MEYTAENRLLNRAYLKYLIPGVIAYLFGQLAPFVDSLVVSHKLGEEAFSAIGLVFPIYYFYNILGALAGTGGGAGISRAIGAGDDRRAKRIFTTALMFALVGSLFFLVCGLLFLPRIILLLGATEKNDVFASTYLRIILFGAPFYIFTLAMFVWLYNANAPRLAMWGMCSSNIVNIVFDLLFVLYWDCGIAGAAWATVLGLLTETVVYLFYFMRPNKQLNLDFSRDPKPYRVSCLMAGLPDGLTYLLKFLRMWIINILLILFCGNNGVVVATLVNSFIIMMTVVTIGIDVPIVPMISTLLGEQNFRSMEQIQKIAVRYACVLMLPIVLFFIVFPDAFLWLFTITDPISFSWGKLSIQLVAMSLFVSCLNTIIVNRYIACGKPMISLQTVVLREFLLLVPLAWILGLYWNVGGVWAAFIAAELLTLLWLIIWKKQFRDLFCNKRYNTEYAVGGRLSPESVLDWQRELSSWFKSDHDIINSQIWEPLQEKANAGNTDTVALMVLRTDAGNRILFRSAKKLIPEEENCMELCRKVLSFNEKDQNK